MSEGDDAPKRRDQDPRDCFLFQLNALVTRDDLLAEIEVGVAALVRPFARVEHLELFLGPYLGITIRPFALNSGLTPVS